jgi:hypothetical protein
MGIVKFSASLLWMFKVAFNNFFSSFLFSQAVSFPNYPVRKVKKVRVRGFSGYRG